MIIKFEDKKDIIVSEINKRRSKWQLKAISWMDFDDIRQLILIHVYEKWSQWDQKRPLEPWLNTLISNRIKNLVRDNYGAFKRPCLGCAANQGNDLCSIYIKQCSDCPLYAKWVKTKKRAYDVKLPVSYHDTEKQQVQEHVLNQTDKEIDYEKGFAVINAKMKERLKPEHYKIYKMIYIENKSDDVVAETLGYKKSKYNNRSRYKQIENYKKQFKIEAKSIIYDEDLA